MEFRILGPLEVEGDHGVVSITRARPRGVLGVLLLNANRPVNRDELTMALWGAEASPDNAKKVQMAVSRLRKALGDDDVIETTPAGYCLHVKPEDIDAERFERLVADGRRWLEAGDAVAAAAALHSALGLWRGPPLAELKFESFAQAEIARLNEQQLCALEMRIDADLRLGRHHECIAELQRLVGEHPTRERFAAHLMVALYRSGRQTDALEAYRSARVRLLGDIGVEPGPELQRLHQAILHQQSSLLPEPEPTMALGAATTDDPPAPPPMAADEVGSGDGRTGAERRVVTVLFAQLSARGDPEATGRLLARAAQEAETILAGEFGGRFLTGLDGDVVGVFGVPPAHDDDVLRALRAAGELCARIAALSRQSPRELAVAVGIDTGEVIADTSAHPFLTGEPMSGGAKLARQAKEGEVLLTAATRRLVGGAILAEPAAQGPAWRLLGVVEGADSVPRWLAAPIVGRARDLQVVREAMELAEEESATHLLTVLGEPGVGKTRLAHEIATELADRVTVLEGHCRAYGDSIGLWPLREALVQAAGAETREAILGLLGDVEDADRIADIVAAALDLTAATPVATEVPWAFRKLLESLAGEGPVLLIVDDAQWAEPPLLKLVDHLVEWLTASPVLVLCLARPELRESRPEWCGGHERIASHRLKPLPQDDSLRLLDNHPDSESLDTDERQEILRTAEGNPLFIEQLLAMHAEDSEWRAGRRVPRTVRGLLDARLDRLTRGERALINRAAVLGRDFGVSALLDPLPAEARQSANEDLSGLVHRGLVRPTRSTLGGEDRMTFHHFLTWHAAYEGTPKAVRGLLHEEFARWLAQRDGEHDEAIGFHLERAFCYRLDLVSLDDAACRLAADAADRLVAARRRAMLRGDVHAEAKLLQRAAILRVMSKQRDPEILLKLGVALMDTGSLKKAARRLEQAYDLGDAVLRARASIELSNHRLFVDPNAAIEGMLAIAESSIEVFTAARNAPGLARALTHRGLLYWGWCHCAAAVAEFEQALEYSRQSNRTRDRQDTLDLLARAMVLGPSPVDHAVIRCRKIQREAEGDLVVLAVADVMLAVLEAMRSRIDVARELYGKARERLCGLGLRFRLAGLGMWIARVELTAGDPRLAAETLQEAYEVLDAAHEGVRLPTIAAYLARAYYEQGNLDAAEEYARLAEGHSWDRDAATKALFESIRARLIIARSGDLDEAEALARRAVDHARMTDMVPIHAEVLTDLAHVLLERDRDAEALAAIEEAVALYLGKQDRASAEKAVALRAAIHAGTPI